MASASAWDSDDDLPAGTAVGEYVVEAKIGEGAFGKVFRARHPVIGKAVAIKVLTRQFAKDADVVSRFVAEARAVNQISHKNIIDIFAFGRLPDARQYFVMEYLRGKPLDVLLRERGRLSYAEATPVLRAVARALDAAHAQGIAHRDLKPGNVFISFDDDGAPFPKLLDFGIAKLVRGDVEAAHKTQTGAPMGTPYYMSPEQCRGDAVDVRTDVYAFGVLTFQLLTGQLPFHAPSYIDILVKHMNDAPPRASEVAPDLPSALDAPILAMMAKKPADRPASAGQAMMWLEAEAARVGLLAQSGPTVAGAAWAPAALLEATQLRGPPTPERPLGAPALGSLTPSPGRGWGAGRALAASALGALVVVGVAIVSGVGSGPAPVGTSAPLLSPAASAVPAPAADPAPNAAAAVPVTPTLDVELAGTPPGADVVELGGAFACKLPCKLELSPREAPFQLEVRAAGYRTLRRELSPTRDTILQLDLVRELEPPRPRGSPGGTKKPGKDDVETPNF